MGLWNKKPSEGSEDQSKAEMDALMDRFKQELEPLRTEFSALKTDWETIKAEASKPPVVDTRPRDENGNVRDLTADEKQRNLNVALAEQNVQNSARFIERDTLDAVHADWKYLVPKMRAHFDSTPVGRKAQADYPEYCRNVTRLVIGEEAQSAGLRRKDNGEFFLEDKSAGGSTPDSILNDPSLAWNNNGKVMSAREQLDKLGIDPKKFEERNARGVN